ncbi:MAG: hypothetical protein CVV64_16500 [Candidatus Wallbacteria bacterium HGW-Wallbacteria-1]|uniref:Uncharacterized protein n=1 Tax=Candidatus Wallbacteria bacterium HGW-Wallbacteria-1 TaxID=2013854 RepID=A0A2N1PKW6_9BACT|nr:MAG: hypothetical protein CVV64_16500 [Candidatus Wallbacteria bacterium HGW-Wallbacteria-1]
MTNNHSCSCCGGCSPKSELNEKVVPKEVLEYLRPLSEFNPLRYDATYFLKKDGSFVFSEGYAHPPRGVYGKVIYYPSDKGITTIFNQMYGNTTKRYDDKGELTLIPHDEQLQLQISLAPNTDRSQLPPFAELRMQFSFDDFAGYFDHRHSLALGCRNYPMIGEAYHKVLAELGLPPERVGCTGSLMFGNFEGAHDDMDLVFYGTVAENRALLSQIRDITRDNPDRRVIEFGKYWPIRFYIDDIMVCSFFAYNDPSEIPLKDFTMEVLGEQVVLEGRVDDDTHAIFMPPILGLDQVKIDGKPAADTKLVIYDGSMRGDFFQGDKIKARVRKVGIRGNCPMNNEEVYLLVISKDVIEVDAPRDF